MDDDDDDGDGDDDGDCRFVCFQTFGSNYAVCALFMCHFIGLILFASNVCDCLCDFLKFESNVFDCVQTD